MVHIWSWHWTKHPIRRRKLVTWEHILLEGSVRRRHERVESSPISRTCRDRDQKVKLYFRLIEQCSIGWYRQVPGKKEGCSPKKKGKDEWKGRKRTRVFGVKRCHTRRHCYFRQSAVGTLGLPSTACINETMWERKVLCGDDGAPIVSARRGKECGKGCLWRPP